jgi:putative hydrolase of the HAD superfamily
MVRAIFFDYDGVLTRDRTGSLTTNRFLSERTGIAYDVVSRSLGRHNRALNEGATTYARVWPEVCAELGRDLSPDLLVEAFESTPMNEAMLRLASGLKAAYGVGIITDNKKERIDCLKRHQRLVEVFDPIVVSAEVRATKDGPRIFEAALACLGVDPPDSLFIDNTPANLVAPAALGMHTLHFDDERNDVAGLVRLLATRFGVTPPLPGRARQAPASG